MSDFQTLFPKFLTQCTELNRALTPVAVVLFVAGIVSSTITGQRSPGAYLRTVARTCAYVAVLALLLVWGGDIANGIDSTVKATLKADPAAVHAEYQKALAMQKGTGKDGSWWDLLDAQAIFESIVTGILWCFGWFAGIIVFYAHLTQKFILYLAYGFAPLFIGFLAVRTLHSIGVSFLLGFAGGRKIFPILVIFPLTQKAPLARLRPAPEMKPNFSITTNTPNASERWSVANRNSGQDSAHVGERSAPVSQSAAFRSESTPSRSAIKPVGNPIAAHRWQTAASGSLTVAPWSADRTPRSEPLAPGASRPHPRATIRRQKVAVSHQEATISRQEGADSLHGAIDFPQGASRILQGVNLLLSRPQRFTKTTQP